MANSPFPVQIDNDHISLKFLVIYPLTATQKKNVGTAVKLTIFFIDIILTGNEYKSCATCFQMNLTAKNFNMP